MANAHSQFRKYLDEIRIRKNKRSELKQSRDANRERIRTHFRDVLKRAIPKFGGQGSYMMHTGIVPTSGDYDVDDGVYLQCIGTDPAAWPATSTVQGWLVDATEGHTVAQPQCRTRCVRVPYAAGYHLDLPAYGLNAEGTPLIFDKNTSPYESDPKAFTEWFRGKVAPDTQMRALVRYLKGWRDHQKGKAKVASGMALTIMVANNFYADPRDDVAFLETVRRIHAHLQAGNAVHKPVTPGEDVTGHWTAEDRAAFIAKLETLAAEGDKALAAASVSEASRIWRVQLGERFPKVSDGELARAAQVQESVFKSMREEVLRQAVHAQTPQWPSQLSYAVEIDGELYRDGPDVPEASRRQIGRVSSDRGTFESGLWLRFSIRTNAPAGYEVFWQVVNTGAHAKQVGGLRGEITPGSTVQWESTGYTGKHWIQCYLVLSGVLIARSAPFFVNVENPDYD